MLLWLLPLVLLALLGPLFWLLPQKGQGQRMQLRLAARRMGLGMQLCHENWPHWMEQASNPCPQYLFARSSGGETSCCYWQAAPGQWYDQWRERCSDEKVLPLLQQLPEDVYKIEVNEQKVVLCWGERGGLDALEKIRTILHELR